MHVRVQVLRHAQAPNCQPLLVPPNEVLNETPDTW
jgi:hypothetical protein